MKILHLQLINRVNLGKALDDMDKIIDDLRNNQISQESINRGKQVYKRLLEHKNAQQNRGYDI